MLHDIQKKILIYVYNNLMIYILEPLLSIVRKINNEGSH